MIPGKRVKKEGNLKMKSNFIHGHPLGKSITSTDILNTKSAKNELSGVEMKGTKIGSIKSSLIKYMKNVPFCSRKIDQQQEATEFRNTDSVKKIGGSLQQDEASEKDTLLIKFLTHKINGHKIRNQSMLVLAGI